MSNTSKLYKYIKGQDIITPHEEDNVPLIEGVIDKGDYVLFIAEEKVGKTILSLQLCACLSSGKDFLNTFPIKDSCRVWYMFNEVRVNKLQTWFQRMSHGLPINVDNITLIPFKFRFNTPAGIEQLNQIADENKDNYPDVIILDALYKAVHGSIKDDNVVNDFNHIWGNFAYRCGQSARIVVHHLTKPSRGKDGSYYKRTDKDSFGSAYLLADPTHVLRLEKWGDDPLTKERILKCDTQRSGEVMESVRMLMVEPDPLYYSIISTHIEEKQELIKLFTLKKTLTVKETLKTTKLGRTTLYKILNELLEENIITKDTSRPVNYSIRTVRIN